jgi:antitoxin VapB
MIDLSPETETLAVKLAAAQHISVEVAVRQALEAQARAAGVLPEPHRPRDRSLEAVAARHARTNRLVAELASMPVLDPRSPRDIMDDLNAI